MKWADEQKLMAHARALEGVKLGYIDPSLKDLLPSPSTKGTIGHAIEAYFNIKSNNAQEPDFPGLGIELKVTPVVRGAQGLRSKERVSITQINYTDILTTPFKESHLRDKTRKILFVFYEYLPDQPIGEFPIRKVYLWRPTTFEQDALRAAYEHVQSAVADGQAHMLSASDTPFVESATKGAGTNVVSQPNSPSDARRRAFAFKTTAMTQIYRDIVSGSRDVPDDGPETVDEIDSYVAKHTEPWIGKTFSEIQSAVAPETIGARDKSLVARVGRRLLGAPPSTIGVPVLERRGVTVRTTRVAADTLRPFEATSFPAIRFHDVLEMTWEDSPERDLLLDIVFVVFAGSKTDGPNLRLLGFVRWRPDATELEEMGKEWEFLMRHIRSGELETRPTARETSYLHIRPHGAHGKDRAMLPNGRPFVRSSFWLNQNRIQKMIEAGQ